MVDTFPKLPPKTFVEGGSPLGREAELEEPRARIDELLLMTADGGEKSPCLPTLDQPLPWLPISPEIDSGFENMVGAVVKELSGVDPLESLLDALRSGGGDPRLFEQCRRYVDVHGWHARLIEAIRQWIPALGSTGNHDVRAQVDWFLWFEDVLPIRLDACWSHRIKHDLRGMPPGEADAWWVLLQNTAFASSGKPPLEWLTAGKEALQNLEAGDFSRRFQSWFEPFGQGRPMRLTIAGGNILRVLIWYAWIAKDSAVHKSLAGFAKAQWKTRECQQHASPAEIAFRWVKLHKPPSGAAKVISIADLRRR